MKNAIYAIDADPIDNLDLHYINCALSSGCYDKVYIAIENAPDKKYLFNLDERVLLTNKSIEKSKAMAKIIVEPFESTLKEFAKKRGLEDFIAKRDVESADGLNIVRFNLEKGINYLDSDTIKLTTMQGGFIADYVPMVVKQALEEKLWGASLIGVTGIMGAGKTTFCRRLAEYCNSKGELKINHVEYDNLVYSVVRTLYFENSNATRELKEKLKGSIDESALHEEKLSRKALVSAVFDKKKREELVKVLKVPVVMQFKEIAKQMKGIVLVDAAYFTEYDMFPLVNYNVILVGCDKRNLFERIFYRDGMNKGEAKRKTKGQHSQDQKRKIILEAQGKAGHGFFCEVDSNGNIDFEEISANLRKEFPIVKKLEYCDASILR